MDAAPGDDAGVVPTKGDARSDSATSTTDGGARDAGPINVSMIVNGHTLASQQQIWVRYVASDVIPLLAGDRSARVDVASRAAWWSLKEGNFDAQNPFKYSLCNTASGDKNLGPTESCASGKAWQVGLAGVQVPGHSVGSLESLAKQLRPNDSANELLKDAAAKAGYTPGSSTSNAIIASTGTLRASWLLRSSEVGFTVVDRDEVIPECINASKSWCYGTGWTATKNYAPTRAAALQSMADLKRIFDALAP